MLNINKNFLKSHKCYVGENKPKYIVMHETDNWSNGAGANAHARAHYNGNLGSASVHYYVDDKEIYQTLRHEDGPWAVGDNRGYSDITNRNSIDIELCVNPDSNYEVARSNAIELCVYLLKQQGFGIDRLKTHNNASGKHCPRRILDENYWNTFKEKVAALLDGSSSNNQDNNSNDYDYSVKNKYGVVTGNEVRLRDGSSTDSNVLGYANKGEKFKIGYKLGDWYSVYWGNHGAFISASYLSIDSDNSIGNNVWTRKLQTECNKQGFSNQSIDGMPGTNTLNGCPLVKPGAQGNITKLIQERLIGLGYNVSCGADGIFGSGTKQAVMQLQQNNGLSADGIVGRDTWIALLGL